MLSGMQMGMAKTPSGKKRPKDSVSNAVHVMRIATGEIAEDIKGGKNPAAVALGRLGGKARAKSLSKAQIRKIAKGAAASRWSS